MLTFLFAALAAVPSGYTEIKEGNGCKIYKGPTTATGVTPVYATCDWTDVAPDKLHARLADWEQHDEIFSTVGTSVTKKTEGARALVHQVHTLSGISNREVDLWLSMKQAEREKAAAECEVCPFVEMCLEAALELGATWGVWGAQDFSTPSPQKARSTR